MCVLEEGQIPVSGRDSPPKYPLKKTLQVDCLPLWQEGEDALFSYALSFLRLYFPHVPASHPSLVDVSFPSYHAPGNLRARKKVCVVTNIRQASVTEEIGVVSIELDGEREEIKKAIAWLEEVGIKVEPVEINTIEG